MKWNAYCTGVRRGLPVGVGYFSVSFGFGAMAVANGIQAMDATLISLTNLTSAGQFAGLNAGTDALATEDAASISATTYANILVVKEGNEKAAKIEALKNALLSEEVKAFINNTYSGAVVPIF